MQRVRRGASRCSQLPSGGWVTRAVRHRRGARRRAWCSSTVNGGLRRIIVESARATSLRRIARRSSPASRLRPHGAEPIATSFSQAIIQCAQPGSHAHLLADAAHLQRVYSIASSAHRRTSTSAHTRCIGMTSDASSSAIPTSSSPPATTTSSPISPREPGTTSSADLLRSSTGSRIARELDMPQTCRAWRSSAFTQDGSVQLTFAAIQGRPPRDAIR
jgi:hypothetical protein